MGGFTSLSLTLKGLSKSYGLEQGLVLDRLQRNWGKVVGPQVASHTHPIEVRRGTLCIAVDSAVWLQELSFFKEELSRKIAQFCGADAADIRHLRLSISPLPHVAPLTPVSAPTPIPPPDVAWISQQLASLSDPMLRDAVHQAMKSHPCR